MSFSHSGLVKIARQWLKKKRCSVVVSEISSSCSEEPDALGWYGRTTILIECKRSRSDFLADRKKFFRRELERGLGDYRYFLVPEGVIFNESELPAGFGWLEINSVTGKIRTLKKAGYQPAKNVRGETSILLSLLKRIGQNAPEGVSIQCYATQTKNRTVLEVEKI